MDEKEEAARKALRYIKPGMAVGLGTGSTSAHFIRLLGERNRRKNLGIRCIATSVSTEALANEAGFEVYGLESVESIDVAVDGADVIVGHYLIKGLGGGAIAREKAVDYRAKKFVVIADSSKLKDVFGGVVPVEATLFAAGAVRKELASMGAKKVEYRLKEGKPMVTDNGNLLIDAFFPEIKKPKKLEREIKLIPGVVENGIFTRRCKVVIGKK